MDGRSRLVVEMPIELKKSFKLYCTMKEVPMTELILTLIKKHLDENDWSEVEVATSQTSNN